MYPQVEPGAAALAGARVVACPGGTPIVRALDRARAAGAGIVVTGPRQAVRATELGRAVDWGLGRRAVREIAWRDLPVLPAGASEVEARRHLLAGASLVLLRRGGRIVAAVDGETVALVHAESSVQGRLERAGDRHAEARLWLLRSAGKLGEGLGAPVYAVGGLVRDLLLGGEAPDVDLVVEGDGVALARRLGEEIGGTVLVHGGFGTASIEGGRAPAGAGIAGASARPRRRGVRAARAVRGGGRAAGRGAGRADRGPAPARLLGERDGGGARPGSVRAPRRSARRAARRAGGAAAGAPAARLRGGPHADLPGRALCRPPRPSPRPADAGGDPAGGGPPRVRGALRPASLARDRAGGRRGPGPAGLRVPREMASVKSAQRKQHRIRAT